MCVCWYQSDSRPVNNGIVNEMGTKSVENENRRKKMIQSNDKHRKIKGERTGTGRQKEIFTTKSAANINMNCQQLEACSYSTH